MDRQHAKPNVPAGDVVSSVAARASRDPDALERARAEHPELAAEIRAAVRALQLAAGTDGAADRGGVDAPAATHIGRLTILGRVGQGGMGTVYRAHDPVLDREVALKVLPVAMAQAPAAMERFRREARALAQVRHPHIVAIHDIGTSADGAPWFTMDLIEGASLQEILDRHSGSDPAALHADDLRPPSADPSDAERGARPAGSYAEAAARLLAKVADALDHAHRAGVVHRDVKPGNIMVDRDGEPHLVDFGLARGHEDATVTITGVGPGTPAYMAPEQISGRGEVRPWTDVFGLGATLYEVLTLRRAFAGNTREQVFHAVLTAEPLPPRRWNALVPRDLQTVCLAALEKDPARRYGSAAAFAEDLRNLLGLRPILARPAGPFTRASRLLRRNPWPTAAVGTLLLAAIAAGALELLQTLNTRSAFRGYLALARAALAEADVDRARDQVEQALALDRLSSEARDLRDRVVAAAARIEHDRALAEARRKVDRFRALVDEIAACRQVVAALKTAIHQLRWPLPRPGDLPRAEKALADLLREHKETWFAALEALNQAEKHVPWTTEVRDLLAEAYMESWRDALRSDNRAEEGWARNKVVEFDAAGRFRAELAGTATLAIDGSPQVRVHLFRYELQSALRAGGEPRLVPVPFHPDRVLPGTATGAPDSRFCPPDVALAVTRVSPGSVAEAAGLRSRDLILALAGVAVGGAVFAVSIEPDGRSARGGVRALDRLVRLAEHDVLEEYDVEATYAVLEPDREYRAVFERAGTRRCVDARRGRSLHDDLGLRLGSAAQAFDHPVPAPGLELRILSRGEEHTVTLAPGRPAGVEVAATAYPLCFSSANELGALPVAALKMPPGSYLLVCQGEGCEDLRLPLELPRQGNVTVRANLQSTGATPPGFVYVPPGPFIAHGDPEAIPAAAAERVEVAGFFIGRTEVTVAEYAEFLADPDTMTEVEAAEREGVLIRVPRDHLNLLGASVPFWSKGPQGRYESDWESTWPIHGVSAEDADAFVAWRNGRAESRGEPWVFRLPMDAEWEKAARGTDGRYFPWGDTFAWSFCRGIGSRAEGGRCEPVTRFATDESPFGVRDMAGGVLEWMWSDEAAHDRNGMRPWRGGAWRDGMVRDFHPASRQEGDGRRVGQCDGFRLVACRR